MKKGNNIRKRADGRYEARYIKDRDENGKIIYGYCYGKTYEEAEEKRNWQTGKVSGCATPKLMNLLILGAGSHGQEVYGIAESLRCFHKIKFLDDKVTSPEVVGKCSRFEAYLPEYSMAIAAVGDETLRRKWTEELGSAGFILPTLIDPSAIISKNSTVGYGTVVGAKAVINSGAAVGNGCIVSSGAIVAKDAHMANWSFIDSGEILLKEEG